MYQRTSVEDGRSLPTSTDDTNQSPWLLSSTGGIFLSFPPSKFSKKIFIFTSLKKRTPGFKPETSQSAVEHFTAELYTSVS
ncbi:hypothetical protein TNCV_3269091 [Trichonephila clavipes]|nr:hypothetical protein TNCV_3269091 [Trichonephila clavipes]